MKSSKLTVSQTGVTLFGTLVGVILKKIRYKSTAYKLCCESPVHSATYEKAMQVFDLHRFFLACFFSWIWAR